MRIRELRNGKGLSGESLGELVGVQKSAISKYERGEIQPSQEVLLQIANVLSTSTDYLLGNTDDPTPPTKRGQKEGILRIPVYGLIPAGVPMEAIEDILDIEEAPIAWARGDKEFFALKIKGDSMYPKYLDNDVVIFQKAPDCDSGQECAVMVNGQDATFKKVFKDEKGISLQPINPDYAPSFYTHDEASKLPVTILGVVWELRRPLH